MGHVDAAQNSSGHVVVVGFDGSSTSQAALDWALAEAPRHGSDLDVVTAWRYPAQWAEGYNEKWADDEAALAARARRCAEDAVRRRVDGAAVPTWVHVHAVRGSAGQILVERSVDADLLVVGRRGRGQLASALLGSVSSACVHHAACPVVVVPEPADDDGDAPM